MTKHRTGDALVRLVACVASALAAALTARASADLPGGWKLRASPTRSMLFDIDFADDDSGWASGLNAIVHTSNGGRTWSAQWKVRNNKQYWFNSVAALSRTTALACGFPYATGDRNEPGILIRTDDGGQTWRPVTCGAARARFCSMAFRDDGETGYLVSTVDGLMKTTDGGRTWRRADPGRHRPKAHMTARRLIALSDDTVAVAGDGALLVSRDDGGSWKAHPYPSSAKKPHGWLFSWCVFPTRDRGWVQLFCGDCLATTDGGETWSVARPRGTLWAQDEKSLWRTTQYEVFHSTDGGATWDDGTRIGGQYDRIGALAFTAVRVHVAGGDEGHGHPFLADRDLRVDPRNAITLPTGVVDIPFTMPDDGIATVQILDEGGAVVKNLINGVPLPKGSVTLQWDLSTLDDFWPPFEKVKDYLYSPPATARRLAPPGRYRWRALYHEPLSLSYRYSYYPLKKHGLAWVTADRTGGWLADHEPPRCIVARGDRMWLGTFCEGGHSIIEADLDMKKLWGDANAFLTAPSALAVDGEYVYYVEAGGWGNSFKMVRVHHRTKKAELVFSGTYRTGDPRDICGLAIVGEEAFITYRDRDEMLCCDIGPNLARRDTTLRIKRTIPAKRAGGIRRYTDGRLAVVVDSTVSLLDTNTCTLTPVVTGLTNPCGLAVDDRGYFYVGEMDPVHQVKVYSRRGALRRTIGKRGRHRVGRFDMQNLENPRGVEVAADGNVWVTEWNHELKRTSVWDTRGRCTNQVLGPTVYGGGGEIDPADGTRLFYRGKEFRRDPRTGTVRLVNIIWRMDDPSVDEFVGHRPHNFGGPAPSHPFHKNGKMWFRSWGASLAGDITVLFVYEADRVRPVAAVGQMPRWLMKRMGVSGTGASGKSRPAFAWTDRDDDGKAQPDEVETGKVAGSAGWGVRMNEDFEVAFSTVSGDVGFSFFRVRGFTPRGYPLYRVPEKFQMVPGFTIRDPSTVQGMMTDASGNAVAISPYIISVAPDGAVNWRYKCRWPGLHAGLATTAAGIEPGVLVAPLRFYGSVMTENLGEVFCIGTNYGVTHFFTSDGMYVDRAFGDSRRSDLWRYDEPPTPEVLARTSLCQENFGGTFQKVREGDGRDHYLYVVAAGGCQCGVVELHGLDDVRRIRGGHLTVTAEHARAAAALRQERMRTRLVAKRYTIRRLDSVSVDGRPDEWPAGDIAGFRLAYDARNLYVFFRGSDRQAVFRNAATRDSFHTAFTRGDVVDVMLQTRSGPGATRERAAEGDIRLSFATLDGKPEAILYDYVVPGTPRRDAHSFASPWRTVLIDRVTRLDGAKVVVTRQRDAFSLEASVPLSAIHLRPAPGLTTRGDVGRVMSDQTGTTRTDRRYWSNPDTRVVSDVPSEAGLQPSLWGTFVFE